MSAFRSVFSRIFDVVVYGAGYAGYAAATALHARGKSVLLADRRPTALWESGWAFANNAGHSQRSEWQAFLKLLRQHHAASEAATPFVDGAIAEVLATRTLLDANTPVLYYATPIAAHVENDRVCALAVAAKEGVRIIRGRKFIDATDAGELLSILEASFTPPTPATQSMRFFFRHIAWPDAPTLEIPIPAVPGARATWEPSSWPNERIFSVQLDRPEQNHRNAWVPTLRALHAALGKELDSAVMTHTSVVPLATYSTTRPPKLPANMVTAVPAFAASKIATLAERFELGLDAAEDIERAVIAPDASLPPEFPQIQPRQIVADVAVAGTGTGGPLAAIAAARQKVRVTAIEHLPFPGGVGTGAGIHIYYFGVRGGLQEELDQRTREIMPLFGKTSQVVGFHPDAKKCAIDQMLEDAGVRVLYDTTLYATHHESDRVRTASLATANGPVTLSAKAWIDSTGDGDLAAHAGVSFEMGRELDGNLHAYSQSAGRAIIANDLPKMRMMNTDVGFVDPADVEDLTRARLAGTAQWVQATYTPLERPTYVAPVIGIRQARLIHTDYRLTLADLASRRTFPDVIGYTACHYDNHAVDYQFESDEAMFFVWVARQWSTKLGCQLPYRMILPVGLDNLWIACRAAGISAEAHPSLRQQRDIQRLGEVAGLAAALAVQENVASRDVPYARLRTMLEATGALSIQHTAKDTFEWDRIDEEYFAEKQTANIEQWLGEMKQGPGMAIYHLLFCEKQTHERMKQMLAEPDKGLTFRAAALLAMWRDAAAQPRLLQAIESREDGYETAAEGERPQNNPQHVPHYVVAVALLRRCCTAESLPVLERLADDVTLPHNARTAMAITLESLGRRHKLTNQDKARVQRIVAKLLSTQAPQTMRNPKRRIEPAAAPLSPTDRAPVQEDFSWQLHLAIALAESAAHLPIHAAAKVFLHDPRTLVRKAFSSMIPEFSIG